MMKPYLPTSLHDAIAHVEEECGEFIAAVGKYRRFGLDSTNPEKPAELETNFEWMMRELDDIIQASHRMLVFAQRKRDYDLVFKTRTQIERGPPSPPRTVEVRNLGMTREQVERRDRAALGVEPLAFLPEVRTEPHRFPGDPPAEAGYRFDAEGNLCHAKPPAVDPERRIPVITVRATRLPE